jgi:hypothetical protein
MDSVSFKDASTVFQLAFGLNLVAGLWINNFSSAREQFWKKFESIILDQVDNNDLKSSNLFKAIETLFPDFKMMTTYCLVMVAYSGFTVLLCFIALINPVIAPLESMNPYMYVFISTLFVIVNPILYYLFNNYYKSRLTIYIEVLEIVIKDDPKIILLIAEGHDSIQEVKNITAEAQSAQWWFKFIELKISVSEIYLKAKAWFKKKLG